MIKSANEHSYFSELYKMVVIKLLPFLAADLHPIFVYTAWSLCRI